MYGLSLIKQLKLLSANDCYSYAQASVYYIWWQQWDRLREQPQGSRRSKYSTRGVVNDNQIGAKLQEIVNGPARSNRRARSDVGRQRERRDGREPGEGYRVGNGGVLPPDARRAGGAAAEEPREASAAAEHDAAADGRPAGGTGEEHEQSNRRCPEIRLEH